MTKSAYAGNTFNPSDKDDPWTKLFDLFAPSTRVLDLGCSSGNFGKALKKQKNCYVVGVDINTDDLKLAAKNLDKAIARNLEQDDLSDLGTFDYVLMADIIEHLIDPVPVLKKVKKMLKKGGKLVFSVPNMANIATRIELLGGRFEYTTYGLLDQTHLHYYDRVQFELVLNQAGFRVQQYNNTVRDIPQMVLTKQLKKLGLTPNKQFLQLASHIDAITFQFIGLAAPVAGTLQRQTQPVTSKTPHDFMSSYIDTLQDQIVKLKQEKKAQAAQHTQEKQSVLDALEQTKQALRAIEASKGWRLVKKIYDTKDRISRVAGQK